MEGNGSVVAYTMAEKNDIGIAQPRHRSARESTVGS